MLRGAVACLVVAASIVFSSPRVLGAEPVRLRFDITAYRVEGSTLLTNNQVQSTVAPFRGKQRDFADIQRALEALETAYRGRGFSAVQVFLPEQEMEKGEITLRVNVPSKLLNTLIQGGTVGKGGELECKIQ